MPLHVIQTIGSIAENSGGPARTLRDLGEALARAGTRVTIVAGHDPARDDALVLADPALVETRLVPRGRGLPPFADTIRPLLGGDGTILHDNGIWAPANIAAGLAARRLGLPLVITPHGMLEPWALAYRRARKTIAWHLYQRHLLAGAAGLVATAPSEAAAIRARVPGKPVAIIANGVAAPAIVPDRRGRDTATARQLLYLSRLHPKKNLPSLLTAWAGLAAQPEFAAWTLVIAGPDELGHRAALEAQARPLGDRVRFTGPIAEADKAALFAASDLFVLPTFSENFGIVVAEALAAGVPAIVSTGAPWASLVKERCGWHVGTDPASLAAALAAAMRLPDAERRAMGARGHAHVARDFGWPGIAARMLDYYRWLKYGGARPDHVEA